jgi:hypothetical protein
VVEADVFRAAVVAEQRYVTHRVISDGSRHRHAATVSPVHGLCNDSAHSAAIRRGERYGREDNRKVPRRRANAPGPAQEASLLGPHLGRVRENLLVR